MKHEPAPKSPQPLFSPLPSLPAIVRYYDDFDDSYSELRNLDTNSWTLCFDGSTTVIDFEDADPELRNLLKCWMASLLAELSPVTANKYWREITRLDKNLLMALLRCQPRNVRTHWRAFHSAVETRYDSFGPVSNLLHFLCRFSIGPWNPSWDDLVSQLPYPKKDKYKSVRVGDAFLSKTEEHQLISYIDSICASLSEDANNVTDNTLENVCILACAYQHGVRSKQVAMLEMRNVRLFTDGVSPHPAVHLTFMMIKQRSSKQVYPMVRKVKREWASLFVEFHARMKARGCSGKDHFFNHTPQSLSVVLRDLTEKITGNRRGSTDLRHTFAQRMVDAGASEEEVAEALGHSDLDTGKVYYRSSHTQAQRINRALGFSEIYKNVLKIAHARFISLEELGELKGDQQIAGVPHGIPISGIGGCQIGQPSCPFNPVMACYGCPKFMPLTAISVHERVLEDLRQIVKFFYTSSHADRGSPAFQLESVISNVQKIIRELKGPTYELES